jgi:hypothetical protein
MKINIEKNKKKEKKKKNKKRKQMSKIQKIRIFFSRIFFKFFFFLLLSTQHAARYHALRSNQNSLTVGGPGYSYGPQMDMTGSTSHDPEHYEIFINLADRLGEGKPKGLSKPGKWSPQEVCRKDTHTHLHMPNRFLRFCRN